MKAVLNDNIIEIHDCFMVKEAIKQIPGRRWNPKKKVWTVPMNIETVDMLRYIPGKIDPHIFDRYNQLKKIQKETNREKFTEYVEPIEPMPLKKNIIPFQHQIKAYNMALMNNSFAFLMEMGTGKSLTSVAVAARRWQRGEIHKLLVVAPTSVCPVWPREFEAAIIPYEIQVLEGTRQQRIKKLNSFSDDSGLKVAVINYEATWRIFEELQAWRPGMIICDESQRIKTHNAKQSKAMHKLGKLAKYKLILTGTPVQNQPLDFFSQYKFLDETIFGTSYYAFRNRYAIMGGYGGHQIIGYNNLNELIKKAHSIAFRVTKDEALDLPEQIDQFRYCELESKTKTLYRQIRDESYAELNSEQEITVRNVLTRLLRLQQITGGFINTDDGKQEKISKAKLNILKELVQDIVESGKKVVIFARFVAEIQAILEMLEEMGINYSYIFGEVPIPERGDRVKVFQEDPNCKVFVAQIQTAGLGITLTAADTAIFYSVDFNYANYSQARARIHRIGQRNNCTYIHLVCKDTVDEHVLQVLQRKEDIAKMVVDNWRDYFKGA